MLGRNVHKGAPGPHHGAFRTWYAAEPNHNSYPLAHVSFGTNLEEKFYLYLAVPGWKNKYQPRNIKNVGTKVISKSIKYFCKLHEEGCLSDKHLEELLDYLYAELGRRLTKKEAKYVGSL